MDRLEIYIGYRTYRKYNFRYTLLFVLIKAHELKWDNP